MQGFWLPAGGLDDGETLQECGLRECAEEAGLGVELRGLLQVGRGGARGELGMELHGLLQVWGTL